MSLDTFPDESVELPRALLVAGLVLRDKKVLLLENIKQEKRIEPLGGKVKDGEDPVGALVREGIEEIGREIQPLGFLGTFPTCSSEGEFDVHTYVCALSGEPKQGCEPGKTGHIDWYDWKGVCDLMRKAEQGELTIVPNLRAIMPLLEKLLA